MQRSAFSLLCDGGRVLNITASPSAMPTFNIGQTAHARARQLAGEQPLSSLRWLRAITRRLSTRRPQFEQKQGTCTCASVAGRALNREHGHDCHDDNWACASTGRRTTPKKASLLGGGCQGVPPRTASHVSIAPGRTPGRASTPCGRCPLASRGVSGAWFTSVWTTPPPTLAYHPTFSRIQLAFDSAPRHSIG